MEVDFWTFVLFFFLASFGLAFLELALKSTPVTGPDFEKTYDVPPGLDRIDYQNGGWRRTDTGALATREEVETAGLIWREPGGSTTPTGTPPGSPRAGKGKEAAAVDPRRAPGAGEVVMADKKRD
jgi:hypothetical protein